MKVQQQIVHSTNVLTFIESHFIHRLSFGMTNNRTKVKVTGKQIATYKKHA